MKLGLVVGGGVSVNSCFSTKDRDRQGGPGLSIFVPTTSYNAGPRRRPKRMLLRRLKYKGLSTGRRVG